MYQYVNNIEIRKRGPKSLLSDREIWLHGGRGFYRIEHMEPVRQSLYGITIYQTDATMRLQRIIEAESATWTRNGWQFSGAVERVDIDGSWVRRAVTTPQSLIPETFEDFLEVHQEPEEMSYRKLRARIHQLTRKGIDASNYRVDLELKLAVPLTSFVLACVAIPLASRVQRHASVAAILGQGLLFGLGYWVLLALGNSLGQSGALPAILAAWTANIVFILIGTMLFLHYE